MGSLPSLEPDGRKKFYFETIVAIDCQVALFQAAAAFAKTGSIPVIGWGDAIHWSALRRVRHVQAQRSEPERKATANVAGIARLVTTLLSPRRTGFLKPGGRRTASHQDLTISVAGIGAKDLSRG